MVEESSALVEQIKDMCSKINNQNKELKEYVAALDDAYNSYGIDGVKTQLAYILANFIARTENDKQIKKAITDIYKG